ncbi:MAG: response regulator [Puniceicoccaceae bacterium]|nr:MAG: response regulator [Puniceicoccaceae bacterium]
MDLKNVLVVDDEPLMRDTLEWCLRSEFRVATASSGMEALKLVEEQTFPVVVLDLRMEGLDGIATLKRLRRRNAFQKVVILTAHQSMESAIEAVNLGAYSYLTKPCDINKLRTVLSEAHDRYFAEQERVEELRERLLALHDDFFSVLCHEFNTPLNGIIGFASDLKEEFKDDEKGQMAGFIEDAAHDLHGVFMEILEYIRSKLPSGESAWEKFSPEDLAHTLENKCESSEIVFQRTGDFWQETAEFEGPFHSLCAILSKIMLAGRSTEAAPILIHAASTAGGNITFRLTNLDLEAHFGMPENLESIFSPYATSVSARRYFDPGIGLHLATCRNLADSVGIQVGPKLGDNGRIEVHISAELTQTKPSA